MTTSLVLASTSVHRRALLDRLGLRYECQPPGIAETLQPDEDPARRAVRLAVEKARAVSLLRPAAIVIGSDQVASLPTMPPQLLHKPGTRERCIAQLAQLSGRSADFHTAVAVCAADGAVRTHVDHTRVRFRQLTGAELRDYVDREPAFDCAGGFKCEGLGVTLFESVETRDPTALIGLPLIGLCALLRDAGVAV